MFTKTTPTGSTITPVTFVLKRKPHWSLLVVVGALVAMALVFFGATQLEENDAFCASCHSEPESTYFGRTQSKKSVDLASLHAHLNRTNPNTTPTRCIDCHAGPGFVGRAHSLSIGARDLAKWISGSAIQPASTTQPLDDANCLKCHANTATESGFDKHFHRYMARWQAQDAAAGRCISCHTSHTTDGNSAIGFLQQQRSLVVCDQCHAALIAKKAAAAQIEFDP